MTEPASPVPSQSCPKCGYAGIGPCSCEYKSAQPAQLSAEQLHTTICQAVTLLSQGESGRAHLLLRESLIAFADASAVAQRERPGGEEIDD